MQLITLKNYLHLKKISLADIYEFISWYGDSEKKYCDKVFVSGNEILAIV